MEVTWSRFEFIPYMNNVTSHESEIWWVHWPLEPKHHPMTSSNENHCLFTAQCLGLNGCTLSGCKMAAIVKMSNADWIWSQMTIQSASNLISLEMWASKGSISSMWFYFRCSLSNAEYWLGIKASTNKFGVGLSHFIFMPWRAKSSLDLSAMAEWIDQRLDNGQYREWCHGRLVLIQCF